MSIGQRLREERERLAFTQPAFAALGDTTKKSQIDYEKDLTQPKAGYLAAIAKAGADIQYIITGARSAETLTVDESELLNYFRRAPIGLKAAMMAAGAAGTAPGATPTQKVKGVAQQFNGPVGTVTTGDLVNGSTRKNE